jgi:uncharacterized membrane protein
MGEQSPALDWHRRRIWLGDVIWRIQKRLIQWTKDSAANGTPMPEKAAAMARMAFLVSRANAYLSIPLLFFMGAASHYPMFGKLT